MFIFWTALHLHRLSLSLSLSHTLSQDQASLSTKIVICTPPPQSRRKVASMDITKTYASVAFFFPVLISSSPVSILSPPTSKPQSFCLCETMNARDRDRDRWEWKWVRVRVRLRLRLRLRVRGRERKGWNEWDLDWDLVVLGINTVSFGNPRTRP